MRVIGLTGGVGSGKSYVAGVICRYFPVIHINTDDIARRQMMKGGPSYALVLEWLGDGILRPDGQIDRSKVADIVFNDDEKLQKLNSITHPLVTREVMRIIDLVDRGEVMSMMYGRPQKYKAVLVETAILKEAGYDAFCTDIWYVYAPKEERIGRLILSRGYSREYAESVISSQADDEEFRSYCTGVIDNHDGIEGGRVLAQVRALMNGEEA
ncbi:MAG: dephospho-CoA kinase [Lachnospiraceae bacterium]|nr:dephospho-CoA kinase [Lachnospiraceae bacterium]MBO7632953.1 dephospho-CoA kinase [Lachnospiraceae bacterium]MBP5653789.1 dephospho-CoA kinase [Lachnospiraceae bacterium]